MQTLVALYVGAGEETAPFILKKVLVKNSISDLTELETNDEEYFSFCYNGYKERAILFQCIYKETGKIPDLYKAMNMQNKIGVYCTKMLKLQIDIDFEFFCKRIALREKIDSFISTLSMT